MSRFNKDTPFGGVRTKNRPKEVFTPYKKKNPSYMFFLGKSDPNILIGNLG
jgi:hypothetical protein